MEYIDISWPITEAVTTYKNKGNISLVAEKSFEKDLVRESMIHMGAHTGTHVDAPSHFLKDGKSIDSYPVDAIIGEAIVLDYTHIAESIKEADLISFFEKLRNLIVLFKTQNSQRLSTDSFWTEFIYLEKSGAQFLADCGVKAVGIDYLGIERNQPNHETHTALMNKSIPIIEGLRLAHVVPGLYQCICLPIKFEGIEAAPARAILVKNR